MVVPTAEAKKLSRSKYKDRIKDIREARLKKATPSQRKMNAIDNLYNPCTLQIFRSDVRMPPARRELLRYDIDSYGRITTVDQCSIVIMPPKNQQEFNDIPDDCHKALLWDDGSYLYPDDLWCFSPIIKL